jgi:hypothetical protein
MDAWYQPISGDIQVVEIHLATRRDVDDTGFPSSWVVVPVIFYAADTGLALFMGYEDCMQ